MGTVAADFAFDLIGELDFVWALPALMSLLFTIQAHIIPQNIIINRNHILLLLLILRQLLLLTEKHPLDQRRPLFNLVIGRRMQHYMELLTVFILILFTLLGTTATDRDLAACLALELFLGFPLGAEDHTDVVHIRI